MQFTTATFAAALFATLAFGLPTEIEERQVACPTTPKVTCSLPNPSLPKAQVPSGADCSAAIQKINDVSVFGTKPITLGDGTCKLSIAFASNAANAVGTQVESEAQKAVSAIQAKCASGIGSASFCGVTTQGLNLGIVTISPATV